MRVLIVSDLHANPAALAVLPPADAVLCAGDLVDYGPDPKSVLAWCRANVTTIVSGNHDRALAFGEEDGVGAAMREASAATRAAHRALLDDADLAYLRGLPSFAAVRFQGVTFAVVHAVAGDVRKYAPLRDAATSIRRDVARVDVVVAGHTHLQEALDLPDGIAVNPGSVGMASRGGEAQYAVWSDGAVTLHAAPYDVDAAVHGLQALGIGASARAVLERAFREGRAPTRLN